MGYSVRTPLWRYTEYAEWDGVALCPRWNASAVPIETSELYDHAADSGQGQAARLGQPPPLRPPPTLTAPDHTGGTCSSLRF